jgi:hypothetical protein
MTQDPKESGSTQDLIWLLSSFTDNGRSLRSFLNHPQELGICVLTAGLLANSKLMISPEDAIKSSFDIYKRIQDHVAKYQSMTFASNIENVFSDRAPEVEGD